MKNDRKLDHLKLAQKAQSDSNSVEKRFFYEPLLSGHPSQHLHNTPQSPLAMNFGEWHLKAPIWISSMTGGTGEAAFVNQNLARAAGEFGLGMGLGSCRPLLESDEFFQDFNLKPLMGTAPLFANFGIAQVESALLHEGGLDKILKVLERLRVDGVIIHINPMQEWFQPEGDRLVRSPLETVEEFLEEVQLPVMVKEVGQGMGPKSLEALMKLPLVAIEFAAFGGTNFSKLEILRSQYGEDHPHGQMAQVGHTAEQMVGYVNEIIRKQPQEPLVENYILSGGIKSFLDGYYLCQKLNACAIYGQAKIMLDHASQDYDNLATFIDGQIKGLEFAQSYLTVQN